jgi:hypothetical protein
MKSFDPPFRSTLLATNGVNRTGSLQLSITDWQNVW